MFVCDPPFIPITALEHHKDYLFSGEGTYLHIYNTTTLNQLCCYKIFSSSNIHGIRFCKTDSEKDVRLCVFGGRSFKTFKLNSNLKMIDESVELMLSHWISECCWIGKRKKKRNLRNKTEHTDKAKESFVRTSEKNNVNKKTSSNKKAINITEFKQNYSKINTNFRINNKIAFLLSNNTILIFNIPSQQVTRHYHCVEACILYSSKLLYEEGEEEGEEEEEERGERGEEEEEVEEEEEEEEGYDKVDNIEDSNDDIDDNNEEKRKKYDDFSHMHRKHDENETEYENNVKRNDVREDDELTGRLVVFGGTVFNQIIIWIVNLETLIEVSSKQAVCKDEMYCKQEEFKVALEDCHKEMLQSIIQSYKRSLSQPPIPLIHRLTGHDGVILGLDWNAQRRILCSVSDDRSVKLWKLIPCGVDGGGVNGGGIERGSDAGGVGIGGGGAGDIDENIADDGLNQEESERMKNNACTKIQLTHENKYVCSWHTHTFEVCASMYGHRARVWKAKMLHDCVISVGEDAVLLVWSYEGSLLERFTGHNGRSIRSLTTNHNQDTIYTGGGDSSIRLWNIKELKVSLSSSPSSQLPSSLQLPSSSPSSSQSSSPSSNQGFKLLSLQLPNSTKDFARILKLIDAERMIIITDLGFLYLYNGSRIICLHHLLDYQSYSLMHTNVEFMNTNLNFDRNNIKSSRINNVNNNCNFNSGYNNNLIISVANINGFIILLQLIGEITKVILERKIYSGKVFSINWLASDVVATCGGGGEINIWKVIPKTISKRRKEESRRVDNKFGGGDGCHVNQGCEGVNLIELHRLTLPATKQRWITAGCLLRASSSASPSSSVLSPSSSSSSPPSTSQPPLSTYHRLICGDSSGSIYIYDLRKNESREPIKRHIKLLGESGVTWMGRCGLEVYCCGRGGEVRVFDGVVVEEGDGYVMQTPKGFDWLTRVVVLAGELVIGGFMANEFVLYRHERKQYVLRHACGGGHRTWDFHLSINNSQNNNNNYITNEDINNNIKNKQNNSNKFIDNINNMVLNQINERNDKNDKFFKFSLGYLNKRQLRLAEQPFHLNETLIKTSLHGIEIHCVLGISSFKSGDDTFDLLMTGGEDGHIKQLNLHSTANNINKLKVTCCHKAHISSVKSLTLIRHKENEMWLFSAGGGSVLKAWNLKSNNNNINNKNEYNTYKNNNKDDNKTNNRDNTNNKNNNEDNTHNKNFNNYKTILSYVCEDVSGGKVKKGCKPWKKYNLYSSLESRYTSIDAIVIGGSCSSCSGSCSGDFRDNIVSCCRCDIGGSCGGDDDKADVVRKKIFIFTGCSLGFVRVFLFDGINFQRVASSSFHSKCILKIKSFGGGDSWDFNSGGCDTDVCDGVSRGKINKLRDTIKDTKWLLSASTDGRLVVWNVLDTMAAYLQDPQEMNGDVMQPICFIKCHQSGINALDVVSMEEDEYLIGTGSDDNSLCLSVFDPKISSLKKVTFCDTAHCAQITGLRFVTRHFLLTTSIDQRLTLWKCSSGVLEKIRSVMLEVSDILDMYVAEYPIESERNHNYGVFVVGNGLQRISLQL